jgi:hypothetical protein
MSKVAKVSAEKLIEDRQGIEKLIKEFKDIDLLSKDQVCVTSLICSEFLRKLMHFGQLYRSIKYGQLI